MITFVNNSSKYIIIHILIFPHSTKVLLHNRSNILFIIILLQTHFITPIIEEIGDTITFPFRGGFTIKRIIATITTITLTTTILSWGTASRRDLQKEPLTVKVGIRWIYWTIILVPFISILVIELCHKFAKLDGKCWSVTGVGISFKERTLYHYSKGQMDKLEEHLSFIPRTIYSSSLTANDTIQQGGNNDRPHCRQAWT